MLLFSVRLTPTKEELVDGMKRARLRKASGTRLVVQTVVLALVCAWSLIAFFGEGMKTPMSLVTGIAALLLIPVMWFVPRLQMQAVAESMVQNGEYPTMWVFEDGVDFGNKQPEAAYYRFGSFFCDTGERSLVFRFPNDEVIVVPRRLLSEEDFQFLCEKVGK